MQQHQVLPVSLASCSADDAPSALHVCLQVGPCGLPQQHHKLFLCPFPSLLKRDHGLEEDDGNFFGNLIIKITADIRHWFIFFAMCLCCNNGSGTFKVFDNISIKQCFIGQIQPMQDLSQFGSNFACMLQDSHSVAIPCGHCGSLLEAQTMLSAQHITSLVVVSIGNVCIVHFVPCGLCWRLKDPENDWGRCPMTMTGETKWK